MTANTSAAGAHNPKCSTSPPNVLARAHRATHQIGSMHSQQTRRPRSRYRLFLAAGYLWPDGGAPLIDFVARFPTVNLYFQRPLWSWQIERSDDRPQSGPARQLSRHPTFGLNVSNREKCRPAVQRLPSSTQGRHREVKLWLFGCLSRVVGAGSDRPPPIVAPIPRKAVGRYARSVDLDSLERINNLRVYVLAAIS